MFAAFKTIRLQKLKSNPGFKRQRLALFSNQKDYKQNQSSFNCLISAARHGTVEDVVFNMMGASEKSLNKALVISASKGNTDCAIGLIIGGAQCDCTELISAAILSRNLDFIRKMLFWKGYQITDFKAIITAAKISKQDRLENFLVELEKSFVLEDKEMFFKLLKSFPK